jgi:hypothetical protein
MVIEPKYVVVEIIWSSFAVTVIIYLITKE